MNDAGFTLVDALAALLIVGLAVAGVTEAVKVMTDDIHRLHVQQLRADNLVQSRAVFAGLPADLGPFVAGEERPGVMFEGSEKDMRLACGLPAPCEIHIRSQGSGTAAETLIDGRLRIVRLRGGLDYRFQFVQDDGEISPNWPVEQKARRLAAVVLLSDRTPAALLPFANKEPASCAFDIGQGKCISGDR